MQGCAISCLCFNLVLVPLVTYVRSPQNAASLEAHADDMFVKAASKGSFQTLTVKAMGLYLQQLDIPLQPSKTQVLMSLCH